MRKQTAWEREKPDSALAFAGRIMYNLGCESAYRSGKLFSIDCPLGLSLRTSDRCHWCGNPFSLPIQNRKNLARSDRRYLPSGSYHTWREPEEGDVCERRRWRKKRAKRSGSGRNLASLSEQKISGTATGHNGAVLKTETSSYRRYLPPGS